MHGVFVKIRVILTRHVARVVERYSRIEYRSIILAVNSETIMIKATKFVTLDLRMFNNSMYVDAKEPLLLEYMQD